MSIFSVDVTSPGRCRYHRVSIHLLGWSIHIWSIIDAALFELRS
ncbi:hypothetical protein [Rhodanobacter sp. A1T4]|nr:hypothetical protein [Rhodanobacter sp. A1T4]MBB6248194.1 hypothetical protein [Rhodanobacter sp. A1T4]